MSSYNMPLGFAGFIPWLKADYKLGAIQHKPIPRWPDRRSQLSHRREATRNRNVAKRGGAR